MRIGFFYQIDFRNEKSRYELGKQSALDSLGVQVKLVFADSYIEGYKKIANCIKDTWSSSVVLSE